MNNASLELGGTNWAEKDASLLGYTVSDDSGRFSPQEFTFARGSNLAATRIGKTGLIEKGRENVLLQSNQFDTTWGSGSGTIVGGQADKDGGTSAWSFTSAGGTNGLNQSITTGGVQTFSAYIKKNATNGVRIYMFGSANVSPWFNLDTGSVISLSGAVDATIVEYNSEWWRISVTCNSTLSSIYFYCTNNSQVQVVGTITIQDSQLEQGLAASPYIETTTTSAQAGVLENTPRLNYTTGVANPYLLLEPSRTNLVPISEGIPEDFSNLTLTENYGTSPEGVQNSLKVQKSGVDENDRIYPIDNYNAVLVSGRDYSISAFVKNIDVDITGVTTIACRVNGGSLFRQGYEWTSNGLITSSSFGGSGVKSNVLLEDYGDDWWRIGFSFEADGTSGNLELDIDRDNGSDTTSIETWGWQLESATGDASYATSYIPTYGVSATRAADTCSKTDASGEIGQTEGTAFIELNVTSLASAGVYAGFRIFDGTNANKLEFIYYPDGRIQAVSFVGGALVANINLPSYGLTTGVHKFAFAYKLNDYVLYVDGVNVGVDTSASVPLTSQFDLFRTNGGLLNYNNAILYKERLTNAELATLTSS